MRECELARLGEVPFGRYYGSVDSTPLFVALAGLYWQRTRDRATLEALWPNIRAALGWMERYGDRNGDGFIDYGRRMRKRAAQPGLEGFRGRGVPRRRPPGERADRAVRGAGLLSILAWREAALLAFDLGEKQLSAELEAKADAAARRASRPRSGARSSAPTPSRSTATGAPCRVRSSNAGQLLFTGIAAPERAARVAQGLFGADFFSGWGIRTVGARERRYNPMSYHNGSVWPHDNALIALGLARYGHSAEAVALDHGAVRRRRAHATCAACPSCSAASTAGAARRRRSIPWRARRRRGRRARRSRCCRRASASRVDAAAECVRLRQPRLPAFIDWLVVKRLCVGESRLDLVVRRHDSSVAVNLLAREGGAEVEVVF